MKRFVLLALAMPAMLAAQESVDAAMNARLRAEGLDRSQIGGMFDTLTTVIGPRLTGSAAYLRAANFARQKLAQFGASGARLEAWPFGKGWELDKFTLEMVEPRYTPLLGYPEAWSASTKGEIIGAPIMVAGKSAAAVDSLKSKLTGGS